MLFYYILLDFQGGFLYNVSTIYVSWGKFQSVYIAIALSICAICKCIGLGLLTITEDYTIKCVHRLCLRLRACALYRLTRSAAHTFFVVEQNGSYKHKERENWKKRYAQKWKTEDGFCVRNAESIRYFGCFPLRKSRTYPSSANDAARKVL